MVVAMKRRDQHADDHTSLPRKSHDGLDEKFRFTARAFSKQRPVTIFCSENSEATTDVFSTT